MTPAVRLHGAVLVPFSNPGLPISCVALAELIVNEMLVVWLSEPETPVTVIVLVPVVAVLLAVKVRVLVEVVGLVPKVAVTPLGRAEVERVTDPVKPFWSVTLIVLLPLVPCFTVRLEGEAESAKLGLAGAEIVSEMLVVCVREPEVPVIVIVLVPVVAVLLAVNVILLLEVVGLVPKLAVTPLGRAEVDSVTEPVNPPEGVTVMVLDPLEPCVTDTLLGEADSVKFGLEAGGKFTQLFAAFENSNWIV